MILKLHLKVTIFQQSKIHYVIGVTTSQFAQSLIKMHQVQLSLKIVMKK